MKLFFKILGLLLIVIVFGGTLVFLYHKSQEKPVIFKTKSPFVTNIIKKTVATGSVVPRKEIEIKPQVSGVVVLNTTVFFLDLLYKKKMVPMKTTRISKMASILRISFIFRLADYTILSAIKILLYLL